MLCLKNTQYTEHRILNIITCIIELSSSFLVNKAKNINVEQAFCCNNFLVQEKHLFA